MPTHNFERPRGRIVELTLESPSFRNTIGDPQARTVAVYLPPGYDDSDRDYPLFVDLAAYTGSGLKRLAWTAFGESVPQRLDRLVAQGLMGPVVAVFPDAFTSLGGNQYLDTPVLGRWESFVAHELVPALEAKFRLRRGREHRAIYGKSSGGYGALVQGMRHADTWGAVACHSGDMGFTWSVLRDFPSTLDLMARFDHDPARLLSHLRQQRKLSGSQFHALLMLGLAASYDPDEHDPAQIRLPVDPHTCELDTERWARWLAHDPVQMVGQSTCQEHLARLRGLFIDCGKRDQYFLHYGARAFVHRLERYGVSHVYEEFDDDHSSIDYRLDVSLPYLYRAVDSTVS